MKSVIATCCAAALLLFGLAACTPDPQPLTLKATDISSADFGQPFTLTGQDGTVPASEGGWQAVAPSPIAFPGYDEPRELTTDEVAGLAGAFADAARRADEAGFDLVEVHAAHGYLLHEFLSPLSNRREDRYGGSFENQPQLAGRVVAAAEAGVPFHEVPVKFGSAVVVPEA